MTSEVSEPLTVEQWLAYEASVDERHELIEGRLVRVQGGTDLHDTVVDAIRDRLVGPFREQRCRAYAQNRKVVAPNGDGYYPDVVVRCGPRGTDLYDTAPTWAFEVLSPSNTPRELMRKLTAYLSTTSVQGYVVVEPESREVLAYVRVGDSWHTLDVTGGQLPVGPVLLDFPELFAAVDADLALGE